MSAPDITNLAACVADVRDAALDHDPGPADPTHYLVFRDQLRAGRMAIPPIYRDALFAPFVGTIERLGEERFQRRLAADPGHEREAGLMFDLGHAILQRKQRFEPEALSALQEVIADLYDGFLGAEDRCGVLPPDRETIAPIVKLGRPESGPYTWRADATATMGVDVGLVSLPPALARRGLVAWAALAHATAGHDILDADDGLRDQMIAAVRAALVADPATRDLAAYWVDRIDDTVSDVLGILNMGPAAAIAIVAYARGVNQAFTGAAKLRSNGYRDDRHLAEVARGFLAAATVRELAFVGAGPWADRIDDETHRDVTVIRLAGQAVCEDALRRSVEIIARTITGHRMPSLEHQPLGEIRSWHDEDEELVDRLRVPLTTGKPLPSHLASRISAAHLVAAATIAALHRGADLPQLFRRMVRSLEAMNEQNAAYGVRQGRAPAHRGRASVPSIAVYAEP